MSPKAYIYVTIDGSTVLCSLCVQYTIHNGMLCIIIIVAEWSFVTIYIHEDGEATEKGK